MDNKKVIGVVLAGGRSSRMGSDKACLLYKGKPLLKHMISLLEEVGIENIYVSGEFEGYRCIPDPLPHRGPAFAIQNILKDFFSGSGVVFVPVDMPLLNSDVLQTLLNEKHGGYFENYPLPVFIKKQPVQKKVESVRELLTAMEVPIIQLPREFEASMANTNTPEDWRKII